MGELLVLLSELAVRNKDRVEFALLLVLRCSKRFLLLQREQIGVLFGLVDLMQLCLPGCALCQCGSEQANAMEPRTSCRKENNTASARTLPSCLWQ